MSSFAPTNLNGANNGQGHASNARPDLPQNFQPDASQNFHGDSGRNFHGDPRKSSPRRSERKDHGDWLQNQMLKRTRAQISDASGLSLRGAENLRLGESKMGFDALTEMLMNDPVFCVEYFNYVHAGPLVNPGFQAGLLQAFRAYNLKTQNGMAD